MKKFYKLILVFSLFAGLSAKAQWVQTNGPSAITGVNCLGNDGTNLFAAPGPIARSGMFKSTDFGANWSALTSLSISFYHTFLVNGSNNYAAGDFGLYLSTNSGTTWSFLQGGSFYSNSAIVALGTTLISSSNGGIYRSTNNGTSWTSVSALTNATLAVVGTNYIAATSSGIYKSTDDGVTWSLVNSTLLTVQALKVNGGTIYAGTSAGGVYYSTNNGTTWTTINTGLTSLNISCFAMNGTDLYAGTGAAGVFKLSTLGGNWSAVNTGITTTNVYAITIMGANIYIGTNTGIYLSSNFGVSWAPSNNGLITTEIWDMAYDNSTNLLFAGSGGSTTNGAFLTSSNGANWTSINVGLTNLTVNSYAISTGYVFAATNGGVFYSTNNGSSWTATSVTTSVKSIVISGTSIFAGGSSGVYVSTNNGTTWSAFNTGLTTTNVNALTISGTNIFAGTVGTGGAFISPVSAASWTAINNGLPALANIYQFYSLKSIRNNVFCSISSSSNAGVYKTTNNGASWSYISSAGSGYDLGVSGSNIFALDFNVRISTDSGSTWSNISTGLPSMAHYGFTSSGTTVFVGSTGLGVWKRQIDEILCSINPPVMSSATSATICSGQTVNIALTNTGVAANYTWLAGVNAQTTGESTTAQSTSTLSNTITNTSNLSAASVTYTVTPKGVSGGCAGTPQTVTVTVNPNPLMTSNSAVTICSGQSVGLDFTSSVASSYSWSATYNSNTSDVSTSAQSTSTLNDVITNNSLVPQTVTYTVTPTATTGSCGGTPQTVTVTVNPAPIMTSASSATICSGGTVNIPLTSNVQSNYTWLAADNTNTTGESTTLQSPSTLSNTIVNNITSAQVVSYTVTPTAVVGGCTSTQTINVTVNPAPTMTSSTSSSICSGGTVNINLTSNISASYVWNAAVDNPNTTGESISQQSTGSINNTITNNSSIAQIVYYTVTPTSTSGSCGGAAQSVAVTVNPLPQMTSSGSATICSGGTVSLPLNSTISSTFSWIATDNTNTTGESTSAQSTSTLSNTITNNTNVAQSIVYTVIPTATILGSCAGTPQTVTVTVNPKPTMSSASTATICSGGTVNIALTSNVGSTYTWIAAANANTTGESTTLQSTSTLNNIITNNTTTAQNVVYTVIPTSTLGGCTGSSQTVTVTVNPTPVMTSATSGSICSNGTVSISLTSNIASSYSWIATDNPNTTGESTTAQSTSTLSNTIVNNSALAQNVFYSITPTSTTGSCSGAPQTVTVVVNPVPAITSSSSATICSGGTVNIPFSSNVSSSYSWIATDNTNTTGESTSSQSTSTLNNTITNITITAQNVVYTVTPTATLGGCAGTPQTITVAVNPTPTMTSATSATICSGGTASISLTSNLSSTYSWAASANANTTGESTTSQSNGTLSNTITNNSANAQNVVYSVIPTSTAGSCTGTTQTVTVAVNPAPTMTNTTTASICSGGTVNIPLTSNVASSYNWIANDNPNTTGESIASQSTSTLNNIITNNSTFAQNVVYTITPTATTGSCAGALQTVTVVVNPVPVMSSSSSTSICSGGTVNIPFSSNVSSSYSWIANDNTNTTGESTSSQSTSTLNNTITNNTVSAQNVVYTVTPTATLGGCAGTPQTVTVSVNPTPTMTSATSATICSGGTASISLTSNLSSTYSWIASDNANTSGESTTLQSNGTLSNTITNNSANAQNVVYSVIPTSTAGSCTGTTQTVTVAVNPAPTMTNTTTATICSGGTVNIPLTSNVASSYSWIANDNPNTTGESIASQSTSTLNNIITNNTSIIQTVVFTVTPTSGNSCVGNAQVVNVLVNPSPVMTSANAASICSGGTVSIPLSSNISASYTWIAANNANTTGESITSQLTGIINNSIIDNSSTSQNVIYSVIPTATFGGCVGTTQTVTVTVNPLPTMTNASAATICSGTTVSIPLTSTVASSYLWSATNNVNTTGESVSAQSNSTLSNTITNNSSVSQNVIYTVTPISTAGSCVGPDQSVTVTVDPEPLMISGATSTICSGGTVSISLISNINSTYSWIATDNTNTTGENLTAQGSSTLQNTIVNTSANVQNVVYTVTPTSVTGGCVGSDQTISVLVNPLDNANFSYSSATFCQSGNDPSAIITGLHGGTFSAPSGLVFLNTNNGLINLSASTLGSYTITYTTNSSCSNSSTFDITVTSAPSASFSYNGSPYCSSATNPLPLFGTGASGGFFSANPSGLSFVSTVTGEINLSGSTAGNYTITNNIVAAGGCASDYATSSITINPLPIVSFSGLASSYYYNNTPSNLIGVPAGGTFTGTGINGTVFNPSLAGGGTFPVNYSYTDGNGCSNTTPTQTTTVIAQPSPPSICEVSVDNASVYNIIYWDKTQYTKVDSFIIYRETGAGYQRVGAVKDTALSEFIDTARYLYFPNTGNPNAGTYRYKLQIKDSLGNYSPLSEFHNTIYILQTNGTFTWNAYEIEGQPVPLPSNTLVSYDLWRDDQSNGNWHIVNSVAGSQLTQTDVGWTSTLQNTASWRVETNWNIICNPTKTLVNTSHSNIRHQASVGVGIADNSFDNDISVYPNPARDEVTVQLGNGMKDINLKMYNVVGELVYQSLLMNQQSTIDISSFARGVYTLEIENNEARVFRKLVVQ